MRFPGVMALLRRGGSALRTFSSTVGGWPRFAPRGRMRAVSAVLAGLVATGALAHVTVDRLTTLPQDAVLRVGDKTVSEAEFRQRVDLLVALYGVKQPPPGPQREQFQRDTAQAVAASMIIDQAAADRGIVVPDTDAQDALSKIIESKFPHGRAAFDQALGNLRVSEQDVVTEIKRQLTASRVFEDVTGSAPPVTDPDLQRAYEERKQQMVKPERRHLRNIVVDSPEKAQQVLMQARSGIDFAPLAAQTSLDKSTSNKGGDLGTLSADQLERPVADAAFSVPNGAVFGPVHSRFGWNVGQVLEIQQGQQQTLDQVREQLRGKLTEERRLAIWRPWLAEQIRAAKVTYADQYRPQNPDALPPGASG